MDSSTVIMWMILICAGFMGVVMFSKPIKYILRFLVQAVVGMLFAILFNFLLTPLSLAIGINYLNLFVIGILGLPGLASLYIISWLT